MTACSNTVARLTQTAILAAALVVAGLGQTAMAKSPEPTQGGAGGRIVRVTTLAKDGPGSLAAALAEKGRRIIVFEVGGAIDLERSTLAIAEPHVTVAGQTAPSPGITIVRGGIDLRGHDVKLQHLRVFTGVDGQAPFSGWEADSLSTVAAHHVLVENCTFLWGIDENMSASGPRFQGDSLAEWRANTSHHITFRLNLAAEGLANASHPKGEHSKGSLIHDNATAIVFDRNVWAHNVERSPLLKGGVQALMVNNLIYDPGKRAVHYNLMDLEWAGHAPVTGELTAVGNVYRGGNSTDEGLPFLMIGGVGNLAFYGKDNRAVDKYGKPLPMFGRYGETAAKIIERKAPLASLAGYDIMPSEDVETTLLATAGARPWDRGPQETRVLFFVAEGRGEIIDDEKQVGGFPRIEATRAPFDPDAWNLADMTPKSGVYPGQKAGAQEHLSPRDRAMRATGGN